MSLSVFACLFCAIRKLLPSAKSVLREQRYKRSKHFLAESRLVGGAGHLDKLSRILLQWHMSRSFHNKIDILTEVQNGTIDVLRRHLESIVYNT